MAHIESHALRNSTATAVDPLLTAREAAPLLGISVPTFWRRVADGTVPKPIKLGALSRWPHSEIIQVIETAKAARPAI
jgi:predicted DNA-binding transcriptional regulator AlpA